MGHSSQPFWAGLAPNRAEPLDKVLAALHCYHVAPPSSYSSFYYEFTVNQKDHHRLTNGFPELQKLEAAIGKEIPFRLDPSTGKLATMSFWTALSGLKFSTSHVIATGLESIIQLPAPIGPLAHEMCQAEGPDKHLTVFSKSPSGKYAHYFAENPALRTITVIQLALPMQLETDRQLRRLAEWSYVSVFTKVNGTVSTAVHRASLSAPGGAIKLWFSDFFEQDFVKYLPDELIRPLYTVADEYPASIAIPYATIISKLYVRYELGNQEGIYMGGNAHMGGGNDRRPGSGGKRSFSTLARNTPCKTFRSLSTMSDLAGCHNAQGNNMLGSRGGSSSSLGDYSAYQLPTRSAIFRRFPRMQTPAEAMVSPWIRRFAHFVRKW